MNTHAVSVDFWNTLVVAQVGGVDRRLRRLARLTEAVREAGSTVADERILDAYEGSLQRFDRTWRVEHRTPGTGVMVRWIWEKLGLDVSAEAHDRVITCFQDVLLDHPPALAEGAREALRELSDRASIVMISDTMLSPGRTIRDLLARDGLLDVFSGFVFSDESGVSKPDAAAFRAAADLANCDTRHLVHIGDLKRTDVAGALGCGARAVWYTGIHRDPESGPEPHHELESWRDLDRIL